MKVLAVINSLHTNGAEKLIIDTLPKYLKKGVHIELLLFSGRQTVFFKKIQSNPDVKIHKLSSGKIYSLLNIIKLFKYVRHYDIIHVHLFPAQYYVVIAKLLTFSKAKLIFTEHNTTNQRISHPIYKFIDKYIYRYYHQIICISSEIKNILLKHTGLPPERFVVIQNGINLNWINNGSVMPKSTFHGSINESDFIVTQASAFRPQKDQKTLINAMLQLPDNYKLLLVGEGQLLQEIKSYVKQKHLENRVFFLGQRMDIPDILKSSDVIVLSSHYEGLSLSSIEAMASGKPFVASQVPGLTELVKDHGILFEQGNSKALSEIILKLSKDQDFSNKIAEKCVKKSKTFDISIMIDQHISLYHQVYQN